MNLGTWRINWGWALIGHDLSLWTDNNGCGLFLLALLHS